MKEIGDRLPMVSLGRQENLEFFVQLIVSNTGKPLGAVVRRKEWLHARPRKQDEVMAEVEWMLVSLDEVQVKASKTFTQGLRA